MPRKPRASVGGIIYHVLNRSHSRRQMFFSEKDYQAFFKVLIEALQRWPGVRILSLCVMPNHWHLVLWPTRDGELSAFMRWLTQTHTQRWRHAKHTVGYGPLYQGRFKSFIVQDDRHLLELCRYVERNPVRAKRKLVDRAEQWRWSSAWIRKNPTDYFAKLLSEWPIQRPANWTSLLNEDQSPRDEQQVRISLERNRPMGDEQWIQQMVKKLNLGHTIQPPGRPRKASQNKEALRRRFLLV
jgi:putative transposase